MKVLVTGGHGFLGQHVVTKLLKTADTIVTPTSREYDLRDQRAASQMMFRERPDVVIHLAARVGGIGANMKNPGSYFYDNITMGVNLMEAARRYEVKKFVQVGTTCSYPKFTPVPFSENGLWEGYPEETNAPYGIAKKALLTMGQAYREQYGLNVVYLIPTNLYGPGDNFDSETSHVIPALIRKMIDYQRNLIQVWGTGKPTRDFLYVEDAAEAIVLAARNYNLGEPLNLGSEHEISIKDLVFKIAQATDFDGYISFDYSSPDGQPRRCLDSTRARYVLGWSATTELADGLKKTVDWYRQSVR